MNSYKVKDKTGVVIKINADYYQTCTETGISTFYVEQKNPNIIVDLVATFESPILVAYQGEAIEPEIKPNRILVNVLNEHSLKLKSEMKYGKEGKKGSCDEFGCKYITYSASVNTSWVDIADDVEILHNDMTSAICGLVSLKSMEKPEGAEVYVREPEIHFRRWPEYELVGNKLYITTRLTIHHKETE